MAQPPNNTATVTALTGSDQTVLTGDGIFFGGTFTETGGSTAGCIIYDNTANSGTILAKVSLAANGIEHINFCLLYTSPSPRDRTRSRMPSSA